MFELMLFIWNIGWAFTIGYSYKNIEHVATPIIIGVILVYSIIWPVMLGRAMSKKSQLYQRKQE